MRFGKLQLLLLMFLLLGTGIAPLQAQLNYFLYLESENREPFYVRYQNKIHAAPNGYLILSKLTEGEVRLELGFPQSTIPEQPFSITMGKTDRGFLLRNFSDRGWVLYDLQQSLVITTVPRQSQQVASSGETRVTPAVNDPFANMLSAVTQDSTVKFVTVQKDPPPADTLRQTVSKPATPGNGAGSNRTGTTAPQQPAASTTVAVEKPATTQPVSIQPEPVNVPQAAPEPEWVAPPKSTVELLRRFESSAGYDLVFRVEESSGNADTVKLFIEGGRVPMQPDEQVVADSSAPQQAMAPTDTLQAVVLPGRDTIQPVVADTLTAEQVPVASDTLRTQGPRPVPEIKPESNKEPQPEPQQNLQPQQPQQQTPAPQPQQQPTAVPNTNCKQLATDEDFVKLRRRMAQQKRDEDMVQEARRQFQQRCYTTAQLRVLGSLLLTDEWRYRLYDAAMPFVSDFSNFPQLESTIQSEYFRKRFVALLPNN